MRQWTSRPFGINRLIVNISKSEVTSSIKKNALRFISSSKIGEQCGQIFKYTKYSPLLWNYLFLVSDRKFPNENSYVYFSQKNPPNINFILIVRSKIVCRNDIKLISFHMYFSSENKVIFIIKYISNFYCINYFNNSCISIVVAT